MAKPTQRERADTVLRKYGRTYADEIKIRLKDTPAPLFQLLCASLLLSARISAENAMEAAQALLDAKLTTPQKMAEATWQNRVDVITSHGYKRYDESASSMLGEMAELLLEKYGGDLRELREEADRDADKEYKLLQQFKGIGQIGADIFLREVQGIWSEVYPHADARVTQSAKKIGLPDDVAALSRLVDQNDFPRFIAGLVRIELANAHDEVQRQAAR